MRLEGPPTHHRRWRGILQERFLLQQILRRVRRPPPDRCGAGRLRLRGGQWGGAAASSVARGLAWLIYQGICSREQASAAALTVR